jgi:nucleotide-binding universal stress UspA family protein
MKSLVLNARQDAGFEARLQVALDICRATNGHLSGVFAPPIESAVALGDALATVELLRVVEGQEQRARDAVKARLAAENVPWDYIASTQAIAPALAGLGALADLIVLSHPGHGAPAPFESGIIGDVVMSARTPVLVVPDEVRGFNPAAPVVMGWNGSVEAARALKAVAPLLHLATGVHLVAIDEGRERPLPATMAAAYLARHGVAAEIHARAAPKAGVAAALVGTARELGASCLVMGAFGHSRLREFWFGGVTRSMIDGVAMPTIFVH